MSGVTHKAIQSYLSDSWDTVSPDERERLHQLLPDLDALCGFSPEGRGRSSEVRRAWGVTEPFLTAGGDQVGWMIDISERLSVWLAPISAAHADESNDEDDVSLSTWTQAVRQVLADWSRHVPRPVQPRWAPQGPAHEHQRHGAPSRRAHPDC